MMGVTFDTNVLLSATLWDGSVAQKLLFELLKQNVTIYSTRAIVQEYQAILKRNFNFSEEDIVEGTDKILAFLQVVSPETKVDIVKEDPSDNRIIECALVSHSTYIITYDKHLLKFGEVRGIRIIRPEEARAIF